MAPLNYSKWDNIDAGSSDEDTVQPVASTSSASTASSSASRPARPSGAPAPAARLSEKNPSQEAGKVAAVFAPCIGERKGDLFLPLEIPDDHPIFGGEGLPSPVGKLVGFEILVWRMDKRDYREIGVRSTPASTVLPERETEPRGGRALVSLTRPSADLGLILSLCSTTPHSTTRPSPT